MHTYRLLCVPMLFFRSVETSVSFTFEKSRDSSVIIEEECWQYMAQFCALISFTIC